MKLFLAILFYFFFCYISFAQESPRIENCAVFPADNIWNQKVDALPVHSKSNAYIKSIGADKKIKADFGSGLWEGGPIGIPFQVIDLNKDTKTYSVSFEYSDESDKIPYPIPSNPKIEGGEKSKGDRHIIIIDKNSCSLFELYSAYPTKDGWKAGSGAVFDLNSNKLRPDTWTSADAAGLPIFPGLVRYDEILQGEIRHAIRFTIKKSQKKYVWPARHFASNKTDVNLPPMGQRFRLRKSFKLDGFSKEVKIILKALQEYGMIVADNGSDWFISGAPDERWNNDILNKEFRKVKGEDFEAVDSSKLQLEKDSGATKPNIPQH